jgi:hypothetical protein
MSEQVNGLFESTNWMNYSIRVSKIMRDFHTWLKNGSNQGMRIYGYGAAAKASTLLNAIDLQPGLMNAIADASQEKQNRFMPPNGIEIISPQQLFEQKPTDIVIFPWNIKSEIASSLNRNLGESVRLWCAIPEMHQVQF